MTSLEQSNTRTTAIGLFNQAESYRRAAKALMTVDYRWTHPNDPIYNLFHHSTELFLKSYIRRYETYEHMKSFNHNLKKLVDECTRLGIKDIPTCVYFVENFDLSFFSTVRYIRVGYAQAPTLEFLSKVTAELLVASIPGFLEEHPSLDWSLGGVQKILQNETFNLI